MRQIPQIVRVGIVAAGLLALGACSGIGKALGDGKNPPDEFAIVTKAPLVVPPDYSLRPPKPGEKRPQELSSADRARQILMGDTSSAPPSMGEQVLLQRSGVLSSDPGIRQVLASENGDRAEKDGSLANQLLFWNFFDDDIDDTNAPLRVENPEQWLAARERAIKAVTGEEGEVVIRKDDALVLPGVF